MHTADRKPKGWLCVLRAARRHLLQKSFDAVARRDRSAPRATLSSPRTQIEENHSCGDARRVASDVHRHRSSMSHRVSTSRHEAQMRRAARRMQSQPSRFLSAVCTLARAATAINYVCRESATSRRKRRGAWRDDEGHRAFRRSQQGPKIFVGWVYKGRSVDLALVINYTERSQQTRTGPADGNSTAEGLSDASNPGRSCCCTWRHT